MGYGANTGGGLSQTDADARYIQQPSTAIAGGRVLYDGSVYRLGVSDDMDNSSLDTDLWTETVLDTPPTAYGEGATGYSVTTASGSSSGLELANSIPLTSSGAIAVWLSIDTDEADLRAWVYADFNASDVYWIYADARSGTNISLSADYYSGGGSNIGTAAGVAGPDVWVMFSWDQSYVKCWYNLGAAASTVPNDGWVALGSRAIDTPVVLPPGSGYPRARIRLANRGSFPAGTMRARYYRMTS